MKRKSIFLQLLLLVALLVPWVTQAQVAKVSEYDFAANNVAYASIAGNGGTVWSAADVTNGYTTITMPFAMQYGQTSIGRGATLYVSANGYVTTGDPSMSGIVIAPLGTPSGFGNIAANTIYTKVESNKVTVEWRKLKVGNNVVSFQLVLTNTGTIKFNYGPMTLSTTAQVYAGMQSSAADIYCVATINNRWDTIVPTYTSLTATRTLSPSVHPYYNVDNNQGLSYTFTQPECAKPNSFGAVPSDFSVIFNWTGNGSKYQIKYNEGSDFAPMTQGTLLDNLTGNTYTLNNLPQRTTYYAYIRAFCATSGSWSAWRAVADESFSTGCGYEALPMVQNFTTAPECWDVLVSNNNASNTVWLDGDILRMRAGDENGGYASQVFAVLPKFNANLNNYELDINGYRESSTSGTLTLGYFTNINNMSGFVVLDTLEGFTTTPQNLSFYLTDYAAIPSGARLALRWSHSSSYWDFFIDEITVKPQPTCFPISNLQVSNITPTSAKFSFTDGHNTSTAYQLVYGAPGFSPAAATPVAITNGGVVNTLEGSTHYEAYVRAICGTEPLDWIGPVDFFTPCPAVTVSAANPFKEEFNSDELPNCWSKEGFASSDWSFESGNAKGSSSSCGTDCEAWLYTPVFSFGTGDIILSFKHKQQDWAGDQNYLTVYYRTSPSDEWHQIVQYTNSISDMTNEEMILPYTANASQYQLAFTSTNSYGYAVYLDDVKVRPAPTCAPVANLAISPSKVLTWTAGNATQWQVRYGIAGSDNYTFLFTNAATATLPLTGAAGTQYEISARSICGAGDTNDWADPVNYTMPLSLPYSCDFENGATGFITQSTGNNEWVVGTAKSNGGNGYYVSNDGVSNVYATGSNIAYAYVTLPFETAGDYMVKYDWTANGESTWDFLRVALVPDNVTLITSYSNSYNSTTPTGWIPVDGGSKLNLNTSWNTYAEVINVTTPGIYKLVFAWMNDNSGEYQPPAAIDNVSVRALNCNAPTNLAISPSKVLTWTAGNATQWQVRWAEDGSDVYTLSNVVTTASYTLPLTGGAGTTYNVSVRSICGAGDTLDWTAPLSYTIPVAIPYSCDFENGVNGIVFANGSLTNKWYMGTADNNTTGGSHSIYISNNSGTSADYNKSSSSVVYAYVTLPMTIAADYNISYDWKCYGESTYDYLRVALVPESVTLTPGTSLPSGLSTTATPSTWIAVDGGSKLNLSSSWNSVSRTVNISTPGNYKLVFVWRNDPSSGTNPPATIDNISVTRMSCNAPADIAYSAGTVTWTAGNATQWQVRLAKEGSDNYTYAVVNNASYTPTGLLDNTSYTIGIRSICGVDDTLQWTNTTFRTPCGAIQVLPYAEDFSGYTGLPSYPYYGPAVAPHCWNYYSNGTNTAATTGSSSYYGSVGTYSGTSYGSMISNDPYFCMPLYVISSSTTSSTYVNYNTQRGDTKYAVMPQFDQPLNNIMVSFDYKFSSSNTATTYNTALELGYITENDVNTFVSMQTYAATSTAIQHIVDMSLATLAASAPADARLTLKYSGTHNGTSSTSSGTVYCGIDNIRVKVIPNCFAPQVSTMTATNVTPTSATVSWVDQNTNTPTSWSVKYSSNANFDPATEGTATTVNTPTINLNGLESQTTYYVYVGVDCGSFGESEWSNAFTFTTECVPMTVLPYVYGFEDATTGTSTGTDFDAECWKRLNNGTTYYGYPYISSSSTYCHSGSRGLYWYNATTTGTYGDYQILVLPGVDATSHPANTLQMKFWAKASSTSYHPVFQVGVMTDPNDVSTFVNVATINVEGTTWTEYTAFLDSYTGNGIYVALRANRPTSAWYAYVDDFELSVIPPCIKPSNAHTTALTYNAATIDWTQNTVLSTESSWDVMFGPSPLDTTTATVTTLTDHVFNATGLDEQTSYDFYVRANCGADGYSDWSIVYTFTTPCAPIAVTKYNHYTEDFESTATNNLPDCWTKVGTGTVAVLSSTSNAHNSSYYLRFSGSLSNLVLLPETENEANTLQLNFWTRPESYSNTSCGSFSVGYVTDAEDASTFVAIATYNHNDWTSNTHEEKTVYMDAAPAGARMAMRHNAGSTSWYWYVDDIEVMPVPTCRVATNLTSENVYAKTANLSWTDNCLVTPAAWEVRYAPVAADLDNEGVSVEVTGAPALALANLLPETAYQWKVRSICVAAANYNGDTADWSNVANFTTMATCVVPTLSSPVASANSVTLSWTENTMPVGATQWEVAVGEPGFNKNIDGMHFTTNQNSNFVVTGLKHSTAYQVYVSSLCSDEDWSEWSTAANFSTSCAPWQYADMPLVQTFSVSGLPACWTKAGGYTITSTAYNRMEIYGTKSMVVLPEMAFALDTIEMSLEAANYSGTTERSFQVGYLADGTDTTTFTAVQTITLNSPEYNTFNISFADINNTTGRYIAIRGLQTGTTWADFYVKNVQVKLREPIAYLPSNETESNCVVFYMADTVNHENTYAGNVNMTQTIYPGEPGKVLHLTGMVDCEYGYDYLTIYEGVGTNGTILYSGTGYDDNIDIKTNSYDWVNKGAMTIVFTSDVDNADQYLGFKLLALCECPTAAPQRDWVVDTNTAFAWVNGRTYTNNVTIANQPDKTWNEEFMEKNLGQCDSVYHTLNLTIHPTYNLTARKELCQRESFEFYDTTLNATGVYTRTKKTAFGADSTTTLTLQVRPAPTAYIYVDNERTNGTIDAFCDNADLVMTARATIEGSNFKWEDNSTAAVRTVNPHENASYSVIAYDPTYNCPSLPVDLAVTTTPVPELSIVVENGDSVICAGGSTTLTVADANNTECTYVWSNNETGNSITVSPATTTTYTVTATTPNASACVATASAVITVNQLPVVTITPSANEICRYDSLTLSATEVDGYNYNWTSLNGATTAAVSFVPANTGRYNLTVTDANGCVNEFTSATVTVRPAYNINDTLSVCEAMLPVTWDAQTLSAAGNYDQTWNIAYGCDSTVHLYLDVTATGVSNAYATYCEGSAFTFGQGQYMTNHVADLNVTSLSYIDSTSEECPVQYNLYLTVNPKKATSFEANECDSYTWNEVEYTAAGSYNQTLQTINGCDSVVTLNLTLRNSTIGTDVQTVCDKLVWIDGNTYTENNTTAQYTIQNEAGCDSVVTLNLTVNYANTGVDDIRWCNTPTYTWINGVTYDMNETDGNVRYLLPNVTNQYGCDSTQILNLVFNLAADTMAWADTAVCDIFILDTVACDGSLVECQINQSGAYQLKTSIGNGRYVVSRYNVTINHSEYHTTVKRNVCLPYTWTDANDNFIAVINDIFTGSDTNISLTFAASENGCDRTEVLRLINAKPQTYNYVSGQVCLGETYSYGSYVLTPVEAGETTYRLATGEPNSFGCDSTDVLTLTVFPTSTEEMEIALCENSFEKGADSAYHYTFVNEENATETVDLTYANALNGSVYNGSAVANWTTENGCARTVTVNFTVKPNTSSSFETTELYTYTWDLNGETYDNEGVYTATAIYGENSYGCDSIITMNLTLHDTVYTVIDTTVCTSYKGPDDEVYRDDRSFTKVLAGASHFGTDSVIVTNFYVNQNPLTDVYVATNVPYTWVDGIEYTATGEAFYTLSDKNGCDSTLHLFFTKLNPIVLCYSELPYETGYGFTITDPISNTYSNNDLNGNDTIVSYVINQPIRKVFVDTACDNYTWDATALTYNESGVYFYDYTDSNSCPATDTLKLTVFHNTNSSETVTACDTYTWNNNGNSVTKTENGVYYSNYLTTDNCPSVDTLYLTVNYNTNSGATAIACDSYTWHDSAYTATGEYTYNYTAGNGCASVDTLYLTIGTAGNTNVNANVCDSYTWTENGVTYTESTVDSVVYQSVAGCDSTITLTLTVRHSTDSTVTEVACDTYTWAQNGETYTVSGNYVDTIANEALCDSIVTLNLTVNYNSNTAYTVAACDSYEWTNNGNTVTNTVSGTYFSSYTNVAGCPSVDTLYLTINNSKVYDTTIYSSEGFYQFNLVANDVTYDTLFSANAPTTFGPLTATLTTVAGCDSVVTYTFVVGTTRTKTEVVVACQEYTWPRNNVTYEFIDAAESAANNNALYKTTTGTYIYEAPIVTITNNNAIDSTFILQLVLTERYTGSADTTFLLSNETLALGDSVFNFSAQKAAGYRGYTETVQRSVYHPAVNYCDSLINYNITLVYNYDTAWVDICAEQTSVNWGTHSYVTTTPGTTYIFDTVADNGWFQTLVVNQKPVIASTDTKVACDTYTWIDGVTYTASNTTATDTLTAFDGCDSVVTLNLTIKHSNTGDTTAVSCGSFTWYGTTYTASTEEPTHLFTNAAGCDSTVTLHLTINNATTGDTTAVACESFTWYGTTYTASTEEATHTFANGNATGCDSTVTLHLTINMPTSSVLDTAVCDNFEWNNVTYTESANVVIDNLTNVKGCDSTATLHLTIKTSNTGIDEVIACDSLRWIDGTLYTINNYTAQHTIQNVAGCDSVVTLNLTINHATHNITNVTDACDNYVWTTSGMNYVYDANATYPLTITHNYVNGQNCPSVDTLKLTLHQSSAETFYDTVCDSYTWVNNGNSVTYTESGIYTSNYINTDNCPSTDMLYLTINVATTGNDEIIANNGYYRYDNVLYTADRDGGEYFDTTFTVASGLNAAGCDSTTMLHLLVGTNAIGMENQVVCDHFTWINGHTYEYRENAPEGALYYDATADEWVYARPRYTLPGVLSANGFDTIAVLNLTLTQINYTEQNVRFLLSQQQCFLTSDSNAAYTINFSGAEAGIVDTAFHFGATTHYCDSVITYHITLVDNYTNVGTEDICATVEDYTWNNTNILGGHSKTFDMTELITDFDHVTTITLTDTVFKGDADNEWVYAKTLVVHPVVYATERRTACDSYEWNGTVFTASTTTATRFFPNGSSYGCDSTVTLNLTIKYNSNTAYTATACDEYTWTLNNNQVYTTSGDYTRAYTAANGCPSVDTLHLTVNYKGDTTYTVTACDSYEWNSTTYTTSGHYGFSYNTNEGCASVDSLFLTVNHNSNSGETVESCNSYTWNNHGNVIDTNVSGVYFSNYINADNCPSVDTLYLTINKNNGQTLTESVCDSYTWAVDGQTYTQTGVYTFDSTDANGCYAQCTLNLTVGYTTNNAETVVACHAYNWHGTDYSTSGDKLYAYTNDDGCPSVDTLHLTINNQTTYAVQTIENCGPYTWTVGDSIIGVFDQSIETSTTLTNPRTMCDSVVFLRLTVFEAPHAYETATVCADALPYTWRGIEFAAAGDTAITTAYTDNCDSTIHFALTVNPLINVEITDVVCLGQDYSANNFVIAAADLTAGTHTFSHTDASVLTGCDSTTTLTLTVGDVIYNAAVEVTACDTYNWTPGDGETYNFTTSGTYNSNVYANNMGCSSVDVLNLTINENSSTGYNATACDTYTWNNTVYTESGDYTFAYSDANGCASVDTLHLVINNNSNSSITAVACDSYEWHGTVYTTSGDYTYDYSTNEGCASVDTLHLTVNYNSNSAMNATACDSYEWNGTVYTESGDYTYNYNTTDGCASVDTLHLTVNFNSNSAMNATACDSYTWNNTVYTESGDYTYSYTNADGCASVDTLHLTVNYNSSNGVVITACDGYEWHGQNYTSTGVYYYPYNTEEGCASLDTLRLTVNYNSNSSFTETACDSYEWNGTVYTTSGDYTYSYTTVAGCASTDTLHLTVNYNSNLGTTITACDSYNWKGTDYTTSGTYYFNYTTEAGCASVDTLYLTINENSNRQRTIIACDEYTWNGETYYQSGDYYYSYTANNGCPSVDTLHLTVNYNTSTKQTVVACDEYTWNGTEYNASGMYIHDYVAANNCESSDTLMLTINNSTTSSFTDAACNYYIWDGRAYTESGSYDYTYTTDNGCDSVVTLNLTINTQKTSSETATACGSYTWNGATYNVSGIYTYNTTSVDGCDSVVTLALTISQAVTSTINASACNGYVWNGTPYTASGNYTATYTAANGCDSVVTLVLTINQPKTTTIVATACDSYTWAGTTYTTSGNYSNTTIASNGCDSIVTLQLTINNATASTVNVTACESYTWIDGQTYTASTTQPTMTFVNANGCDSVVTLNLTVNNAATSTTYMTACDSYTWNGNVYTTSGNYTYNGTAANGCDSIATLVLTVNSPVSSTTTMTACESYTWNGNVYTNSGIYTYNGVAVNGCDSTATLILTVNQPKTNILTVSACDSYTWDGTAYTTSGEYSQAYTAANGCDSIVTLALTVNTSDAVVDEVTECDGFFWINGVYYTESTNTPTMTFVNAAGCDSVVTLNLTVNHSVEIHDSIDILDTQLPYNYNGFIVNEAGDYWINGTTVNGCDSSIYLHVGVSHIGVDVVSVLDEVKVYPNPTRGHVTVSANEVVKVEVFDLVGRLVASFDNTANFDISNLAEGSYTLRITLPEGVTTRRIVKK